MKRWSLAAALVLVVAVLAGLSSASAADLEVEAQLTTVDGGPCTTDELTVTQTRWVIFGYLGVRLSEIPAECRGLPIAVSSDGGASGSSTAGATSSSVDIDTGFYWVSVRDFSAVFDGWHVPLGRAG